MQSPPPRKSGKRVQRRYDVASDDPVSKRSPFQRDHDRLFYTPYFHRLAGVTQVVATTTETSLVHNRLTHSLKVAQLGRRLAVKLERDHRTDVAELGGLDPDVVAAAALAHDIGNPPFGHLGESALDELATSWGLSDGFEGNAQSFRVVTKLAIKSGTSEDRPGLDLTAAVRNSILKYPWTMTEERRARGVKKWGYYESEAEDFAEARAAQVIAPRSDGWESRSLEGQLMDLCDDLSYALHDLEDFIRSGTVSLHTLSNPTDELVARIQSDVADRLPKAKSLGKRKQLAEEAWDRILRRFASDRYRALEQVFVGSIAQEEALHHFVSATLQEFVKVLRIKPGEGDQALHVPLATRAEIQSLKLLTWELVISKPGLRVAQQGQRRLILSTGKSLEAWLRSEDSDAALPGRLASIRQLNRTWARSRSYDGEAFQAAVNGRSTLDYIASMTERQLLDFSAAMSGASASSLLGSWIR